MSRREQKVLQVISPVPRLIRSSSPQQRSVS
jgi:hypothetical protein